MSGIVHLAGPEIEANGWLRQRCAWCGAVLVDYELANVARQIEPEAIVARRPSTWPIGSWVRIDGVYRSVVDAKTHPEDAALFWIPEESCMAVDPAITA